MLDGLRGMAAMIVVVSHCALYGYLPSYLGHGFGQTGVGIFYGLSGFLMAHVCFNVPLNRATVYSYAVARTSRVLPLFYVVAILSALLLLLTGWDFFAMQSLERVAKNLFLLRGTSALWSIPVEVQFYVVFVSIWWARQSGKVAAPIAGFALLAIVAIALKLHGVLPGTDLALPYWIHFFLLGVLVHILLARNYESLRQISGRPAGLLMGTATLLILLCSPPQIRGLVGQPNLAIYADPLVILEVPLLLLCCCLQLRQFAFLNHPIMRWFGKISFSLYLLHVPLLDIAQRIHLDSVVSPFGAFALVAASATLIAALSNKFIEKPCMIALRRWLIKPEPVAHEDRLPHKLQLR